MRHIKQFGYLLFGIIFLISCSKQVSEKEEFLLNIFNNIEIAMGYERHCITEKEEVNTYLVGNAQQMVFQMIELISEDLPEGASDEDKTSYVKTKLDVYIQKVRPKIDRAFEKEGCKSPKALAAKQYHKLFSETHPAEIFYFVQSEKESSTNQ